MSRIDRLDAAEALASGAVTLAWYALPDAVASRRARAAIKVGLTVPMLAIGVAQARRAADTARAGVRREDPAHDVAARNGTLERIRALTSTVPALDADAVRRFATDDAPADDGALADARRPADRRAALLRNGAIAVVGGLVIAGTVAGSVAAERGIHRFGQRLGARGVRLPHTRIGLVAGVLVGGLSAASARVTPHH